MLFSSQFSSFDPTIYMVVIGALMVEILLVVVPIVAKVGHRPCIRLSRGGYHNINGKRGSTARWVVWEHD